MNSICCTLREDLLVEVAKIATSGEFDYLLIESTGVSEPMPVAGKSALVMLFHMNCVFNQYEVLTRLLLHLTLLCLYLIAFISRIP